MLKNFFTILIVQLLYLYSMEVLWADDIPDRPRPPTTIKKYVKGETGKKLKMVRKKIGEVKQNVLPEEPANTVDLQDLSELDISDIIEPSSDYQFTFDKEESPFTIDLDPPVDLTKEEAAPATVYAPTDVDVSKILIKGIWLLDNGQRKALIQEGPNKTTIVGVGYKIGEGRIVSIKKDAIVVGFHSMKASGVREYKEKVIYFTK